MNDAPTPTNPGLAALARQQGMALMVTMIVLSVVSLTGIYALNSATMESRVAGNYRNAARAQLWAETGRAVARKLIMEEPTQQARGGPDCQDASTLLRYPQDGTPMVEVCIVPLAQETTRGTVGGSATSGGAVLYGRTFYYRILARTTMADSAGQPIGFRAIESMERVTHLQSN